MDKNKIKVQHKEIPKIDYQFSLDIKNLINQIQIIAFNQYNHHMLLEFLKIISLKEFLVYMLNQINIRINQMIYDNTNLYNQDNMNKTIMCKIVFTLMDNSKYKKKRKKCNKNFKKYKDKKKDKDYNNHKKILIKYKIVRFMINNK